MKKMFLTTRNARIFCVLTMIATALLFRLAAVSDAAGSTTVKVKVIMSGPEPTMLPAGDDEGHFLGLGQRTGEAVFSDGRKAKYSNVFVVDFQRGKSAPMWGYTKMVFEDGSWLFFKWESAVVGRDETGPIGKGTGTILKGAGQYKGINGKVVFTNRVLKVPPGHTEANAELTYTIGAGSPQETGAPAGTPFTGSVTRPSSSELTIGRVQFEPGSRTYWHSHPNGQLIMVEKGRGSMQRQGEPVRNLGEGEAVFTGPNVLHWHGAAPDQSMTQVTIGFGGTTQWREEVTEEQYSGKVIR